MKPYHILLLFLLASCTATQQAVVEKDPVFTASAASTIKGTNIDYWNKIGNTTDTLKYAVYRKIETYSRKEIDAKINDAIVQSNAYTDAHGGGGNGGSIDAYTKAQSDALYQKKIPLGAVGQYVGYDLAMHNFATDAGNAFSAGGDLVYDKTNRQFSIVIPKQISYFQNDKNYGAAVVSINVSGTSTKTIDILFADGIHKTTTFTDLQSQGGGGITTQQLTDSLNILRKENYDLNKRLKQIEDFIYDTTTSFYKVTNFGVMLADASLSPSEKATWIKDSLQADAARYTVVLTQWNGINDGGLDALIKKNYEYNLMFFGNSRERSAAG